MGRLKRKKKLLSAAEKQKRYREKRKQDAEREALYKAKTKLRNSRRKKVSEMTSREHRFIRRRWRINSAASRERKRALKSSLEPPFQSDKVPERRQTRQNRKRILRSKSETVRKIKNLKRKIKELQKLIDEKSKKIDKYRKRYEKQVIRKRSVVEASKSETETMLENMGVREVSMKNEGTKKLVFRDLSVSHSKTTNSSLYSARDTRMIEKTVFSKLLQKYKMQSKTAHANGLKYKKLITAGEFEKFMGKYEKIQKFFLRDDVSHITPGKKETPTKHELKMQQRFLLDSMKVLYKKFCDEKVTSEPASYTLFTKCRPSFVLKPTDDDKDTCSCVQHANLEFMAYKLHHLKVLPTANLHSLLSFLACDKSNFNCMFNICDSCLHNTIPVTVADLDSATTWRKWSKIKEERQKTEGGRRVSFFVNVRKIVLVHGTLYELISSFQSQMKTFKAHYYKIRHQNKSFIECKEQLSSTEAAIIIDFSENYNCRSHEAIQGFHFGASRHQVALHTGVLYMKDKSPISFASISPSNDRSPPAIWAHLEPVLDLLRKDYPNIQVLHFFSSGSYSQYKHKKNFYLFAKKISDFKFEAATWSFFESGLGKEAANGVGETLRKTADQIVAHGTDIPDAETLFQVLQTQGLKVKIFFIPQEEVDWYFQLIPSNLTTVRDIHSMHQLLIMNSQKFFYRYASCFCMQNKWSLGSFCKCIQSFKFALEVVVKDEMSQIYSIDEDKPIDFDIPGVSWCKYQKQPSSIYVLFKVLGDHSNNKSEYRYVGLCREYDTVDGDLKVAFLRVTGENGQLFRLIEQVSFIEFDQIISILPEPELVVKGIRFNYRFPFPIDVYEKA